MFSFANKVVWITGSSTGIGKAVALSFAQNGADVVVHCNRNKEAGAKLVQEIESMGRKSLLVEGDVADSAQVNAMAQQIENTFGRIDILINNAGAMIKRVRLEDLDEETLDRIINVNLKSVFLVTKATLPLLKKQQGSKIINFTSIAARNGGGIGSSAYASAKGGVSTFTKSLAKELAEYGINVNAIAPGLIKTPFHEGITNEEMFVTMASQIPLKREGNPRDLVGATLLLASDYAAYITGEIIEVNGGLLMD